jgi:hypothetical protein
MAGGELDRQRGPRESQRWESLESEEAYMTNEKRTLSVYVSAHPTDKETRKQVVGHLVGLVGDGTIRVWHEGKILPGESHVENVLDNLQRADIVIVLLSSAYLNSEYREHEITRALARRAKEEQWVFPIMVTRVHVVGTPFAGLDIFPGKNSSLEEVSNKDAALAEFAGVLRTVTNRVHENQSRSKSSDPS